MNSVICILFILANLFYVLAKHVYIKCLLNILHLFQNNNSI